MGEYVGRTTVSHGPKKNPKLKSLWNSSAKIGIVGKKTKKH